MNWDGVRVLLPLGLFFFGLTQAWLSPDRGADLFARQSFYVILALFLAWVWAAADFLRERREGLYRIGAQDRDVLFMASALTAVIFLSVEVGFKTLSDETNLLSVSQSMLNEGTAFNLLQGKFYFGNLNVQEVGIPTRPLLFPFLTSLLHRVLGFRPLLNPFLLNGILLWTGLMLLGLWAKRRSGSRWTALAAMLLVLAQPILSISATSAGFDLLSTLLYFGLLALARELWLRPSDALFRWFWLTLLLFCQVRYESVLHAGLMGVILVASKRLGRAEYSRHRELLAWTPLFLLPWILQRAVTAGQWETDPGVAPFALSHLVLHFGEWLKLHSSWNSTLPYALTLHWAALGLALYGVANWLQTRNQSSGTRSGEHSSSLRGWRVLVALTFVSTQAVFLAHHMGTPAHPTQARFFLTWAVGMSLLPLFFHFRFPRLFGPGPLLALSALGFVLHHPTAIEGRFIDQLYLIRETRFVLSELDRLGGPKGIVVTDRPGQYAALGYGSADFSRLNRERELYLTELKRGLFPAIFVIQKVTYANEQPVPGQVLDPNFKTEILAETQATETERIRLLKIVP